MSLGAIKLEEVGFVRMGARVDGHGRVMPFGAEVADEALDGPRIVVVRSEVEWLREVFGVIVETLSEEEVAAKRLEDVLPGTDSMGITDSHGRAREECAHAVGDETIECPIAATDDISCASGSEAGGMSIGLVMIKKGRAIGLDDELGAGFAIGVWVEAAKRIDLAVSPVPLMIFVAFVGGHDHYCANRWAGAHSVEEMNRAHDVGLVGEPRFEVREANERLGGHVDDDVRLGIREGFGKVTRVTDVSDMRVYQCGDACVAVETWGSRWVESITGYVSTEGVEPEREPGSFKASMASEKDALTLPEFAGNHRGSSVIFPYAPRGFARSPKIVEHFHIAQRVHALPEAFMMVHHQLAVAGEALHGLAFEDAVVVRSHIIEDALIEDKEAAIDATGACLRFFDKLNDLIATHDHVAKARRRVDAGDCGDAFVAAVERQQFFEVYVADTVAVGHHEEWRGDVVTHAGEARASHGVKAGVGEGDVPLFVRAAGVNRDRAAAARADVDGEVTVHEFEVEEILFDHLALVAEADDEVAKSEVGVVFHDVPKNGALADRDHGFRAEFSFFAQARALATGKDDNFDGGFHWRATPMRR